MVERSTADTEYVPEMTPGRVLYERWLAAQDISPDDLWDHLDPHERIGWEALSGGSGEVPAGLTVFVENRDIANLVATLSDDGERAWHPLLVQLRAALRGQEED